MILIPAIDIRNGRCVRLKQGDFSQETIFSGHPAEIARNWQDLGAERIHIVDLDGSRLGKPASRDIILQILNAVSAPLQVGGGIRNLDTIEDYLSMGVAKIVLGTSALKNEPFFLEACRRFPGSIILGIDARDGKVAVEGWTEASDTTPLEIAKRYEAIGLDAVVYTDISRDGMGTGVNVESTRFLAESVAIPVIASGGVHDITDIERLLAVESAGIAGVIVGQALYNGTLDFETAVALTKPSK